MKYSDSYGNHIVEIEDDYYLIQGRVDDELTVFREIEDLMEFERDNIQEMLGEEWREQEG